LRERRSIGAAQQELVFTANRPLRFRPGQFLEWTLGHARPDARGVRRYFTIASAPSEPVLRVGVKLPEKPSSFKSALAALQPGDQIVASQVAGDFVLPADRDVKLAFIAGGIGVTPFRSMLQHLIDKGERRDITLLYSNNTADEIAYREVLAAAQERLGLRTVHTLTAGPVPANWSGECGFVDARMIRAHVPDFGDRVFYVSGPQAMVSATVRALRELLVPRRNIRTDYFPGLA
jgi:ferredoxin-NADP reductase